MNLLRLLLLVLWTPFVAPQAQAAAPPAFSGVQGAFVAASVADFDGTVTNLRARGVDIGFGPFPARPDQRANVVIRDDAGNLIQVFGGFAPR